MIARLDEKLAQSYLRSDKNNFQDKEFFTTEKIIIKDMEVNGTKTEPYNGEESEMRGVDGEGIDDTNNTDIDIADVINTVMRTNLITDQEEGMTDEVKLFTKFLFNLLFIGYIRHIKYIR